MAIVKKICKSCKKKKPLDDFTNNKNYKSGKTNTCYICTSRAANKNRDKRNESRYLETEERLKNQTHKVCSNCKINKPISEFYRRKPPYTHKIRRYKLDLYCKCKKCHNEITVILTANWQKNNREKYNSYHKKWRDSRNKKVA